MRTYRLWLRKSRLILRPHLWTYSNKLKLSHQSLLSLWGISLRRIDRNSWCRGSKNRLISSRFSSKCLNSSRWRQLKPPSSRKRKNLCSFPEHPPSNEASSLAALFPQEHSWRDSTPPLTDQDWITAGLLSESRIRQWKESSIDLSSSWSSSKTLAIQYSGPPKSRRFVISVM